MTWFSSRNKSEADLPVERNRIWDMVTNPDTLAALTPLVRSIDADGDRWQWSMRGISALGTTVAPSFTEMMSFDDGRKIRFSHDDSRRERAGAEGEYTLVDRDDGGTHLAIDITVSVDLPLPRASRPAVERIMGSLMKRTGDRFAANLCARLGLTDRAAAPAR